MLIVKQNDNRKEEEGQIFVELTKNRGLDVVNCDRLGYWCDKAHLSHFITECASCFTENELKDILKMNKETIEIKKDSVIAVYNTARNTNDYGTLHALEALFGIDFFKPKNVMERVKTFEDACNELGIEADKWLQDKEDLGFEPDVIAYLKLRIIVAALNEGWKPEFTEDEYRWYPWFYFYTKDELNQISEENEQKISLIDVSDRNAGYYAGFGFAYSINAPSSTAAYIGSRLCLKNSELATYCGKQFIDIWADYVY